MLRLKQLLGCNSLFDIHWKHFFKFLNIHIWIFFFFAKEKILNIFFFASIKTKEYFIIFDEFMVE